MSFSTNFKLVKFIIQIPGYYPNAVVYYRYQILRNICRNPKKIRLSKPNKSQILDLRAHPPNYGNIVVWGLLNWEQLLNMSFGPCDTHFHPYLACVLALEKKNKKLCPIWLKFVTQFCHKKNIQSLEISAP